MVKPCHESSRGRLEVSPTSEIDEEDVEQLEALLARRFHRDKQNSNISYLSCILIVMRSVILLLDV